MTILSTPAYLRLILDGLALTVVISGSVIVLSNVVALALALYFLDPHPRARRVIVAYSLFSRAAPVLALLFVLYYGLPRIGIYLEPVTAALIGLTFASTAYNFEFLRSGFEAIPAGQVEAAKALGIRRWTIMRKVMVPQAYAVAAPSLFSNAVQIVKGSSLASLVAVDELSAASTTIISETYKAIEVLGVVSVLYLLVSLAITACQNMYERHVSLWQKDR